MCVRFWASMIKIGLEVLRFFVSYGVKQNPTPPLKMKTPQFSVSSFRGQQTYMFVMFIFEIRFNLQTTPLREQVMPGLIYYRKEAKINRPGVAKLTSGHNIKRTPRNGEKKKGKHFLESGEGSWSLDLRGRIVRLSGGNSCHFHYKILFQKGSLFS